MNQNIFFIPNKLYKYNFGLYKPLYYSYKYLTNHTKINLFRQILRPGMVVADVGANIGFFSTVFAKLVGPRGQVYAFEPDQLNFKHLKQVTTSISNIHPIQNAVGQHSGKVKLYVSEALNVDHQTYDNGEGRRCHDVPCISLDSYFKGRQVDLIKIDTQGFDFQVILGAQKMLSRSSAPKIMSEFWPYGLSQAGYKPEAYIDLLTRLGYKIFWFSKFSTRTITKLAREPNFYTDFLAFKPR